MALLRGIGTFFSPIAYHQRSINSPAQQSPKTPDTTHLKLFGSVIDKINNKSSITIKQIISFLNSITDPVKLKEIYNLLMLIDESTKVAYTTNSNVKIFHQNLEQIISLIIGPESLHSPKTLAAIFIEIGKHGTEGYDTFRGGIWPFIQYILNQ